MLLPPGHASPHAGGAQIRLLASPRDFPMSRTCTRPGSDRVFAVFVRVPHMSAHASASSEGNEFGMRDEVLPFETLLL